MVSDDPTLIGGTLAIELKRSTLDASVSGLLDALVFVDLADGAVGATDNNEQGEIYARRLQGPCGGGRMQVRAAVSVRRKLKRRFA